MRDISVIIPVRKTGNPYTTLASLKPDTDLLADVAVSWDSESKGANWARNRGAQSARGEYLLFSDDDIEWQPGAIALMRRTLEEHPDASYVYGHYEMAGLTQCNQPFTAERLRKGPCISTMSLMRRQHFPGFDEELRRLQDWDLWLTMLRNGHVGRWCESLVFKTKVKDGITQNGPVSWGSAREYVGRKHNL